MNDRLIYQEIFQEPTWHRWVDMLVVLFIGVICGIVFMQGVQFYDAHTTTGNSGNNQQEIPMMPDNSSSGNVVAPQKHLRFEQV